MSKKMLKRSLALGALMTFVITGNVWAESFNVNNTTTTSMLTATTDNDLYLGGEIAASQTQNNPWWVRPAYNTGIEGSGWDKIVYTGTDFVPPQYCYESVFLASGTGNASIELTNIGSITTEIGTNENKAVLFFNALGGSISVEANTINIEGVNQAVRVNVDGGNSSITMNAENINLSGNRAVCVWEAVPSEGNPDKGSGSASITATNKLSIISTNSYGAGAVTYGDVANQLIIDAKEVYIEGSAGNTGIYASGGSSVDIDTTGKTDIIGGIKNIGASNVDVELGDKGSIIGAVITETGGTTGLDLGNDSTWIVNGDSAVTSIRGNGNIRVDMTTVEGVEKIAEVVIGNTTGATIDVSGTGAVSDYLAANGDEAVQEFASSVTSNGEAIDETLTTEEGMTGGAYTLRITEDGVVAEQAVNTKSDAVSDAGMALKGHWRAHMNDMNKRMGDLRMANGETGVWTRMVRGESEYQGAKMQYNQYQLGYDEKLSVDKRWTVGVAVTFSEGDASYGSGSTDDKSTAFAIYGSKLNNDGTFVDLIARYARLESDLDDRNYGTGDYSTNGMSVSAEFGKRIQQGNGLWIEPQVELTYGTVDSAKVAFSEGYKANYDTMDSFIARAGFALGKDIKQGNVYARASYLYDFDGETETQFEGGKAISEDFGGGWWEVGVGANINLSKATYIYADIEKTFGGEVDTNWQWNLGVRYSF